MRESAREGDGHQWGEGPGIRGGKARELDERGAGALKERYGGNGSGSPARADPLRLQAATVARAMASLVVVHLPRSPAGLENDLGLLWMPLARSGSARSGASPIRARAKRRLEGASMAQHEAAMP